MSFTGPRFLLVDDHALFRMGLSLMLTERWPQAMLTQASTWSQALAHLQAQAVDLVLLDIHLPDGHGLSDLPLLRALAPQARVLLMSSDIEPAQVAQARADGVDGFVPKSAQAAEIGCTEDELLATLGSFLERKLMRRFAAVMNHRSAGFKANAMGVWVVPEDRLAEIGPQMAGFAAVSHCYRRPTYEDWPYTVFTMVHGRSARDCEATIEAISAEAELGKIYKGKVVTIKEFGAFIEFLPGKDGLVHISELSNKRVAKTS